MNNGWQIDPEVLLSLRLEKIQQTLLRGEPHLAFLEAEELLDEHPAHFLGLFLSGRAALELGNAASALGALTQCEKMRPQDPTILIGIAIASFETANLDKSLQCAVDTLAVEPDAARAWYYRALVLERTGDPDEAQRCFARAHALDPEHHPLPEPIATRHWKRALDEALDAAPAPIRAFYLRVPILWAEFPDLAELTISFPPLSPLIGALYLGEPPEEGDPWQELPRAVRLFRGNLKHPLPLGTPLEERISQALTQEALSWTGTAPEDILPD